MASTPDLVLAYMDVFLGGDEMRPDLPPSFLQRLPMTLMLGGNGTYMAPFHLYSDNLLTSIISQVGKRERGREGRGREGERE